MKLPNDVARCHNGLCPFRENCLRWTLRNDSGDPGGLARAYLVPFATGCSFMIRKPQPQPMESNEKQDR